MAEYHIVVRPTRYASVEVQLEWVRRAYQTALDAFGLKGRSAVLRRFFCSDLANQARALDAQPFSNPLSPDAPLRRVVGPSTAASASKGVRYGPTMWTTQTAGWTRYAWGAPSTLHRGRLSHHWTDGNLRAG